MYKVIMIAVTYIRMPGVQNTGTTKYEIGEVRTLVQIMQY